MVFRNVMPNNHLVGGYLGLGVSRKDPITLKSASRSPKAEIILQKEFLFKKSFTDFFDVDHKGSVQSETLVGDVQY